MNKRCDGGRAMAQKALALLLLCAWSNSWAACSCWKDNSPLEQKVMNSFRAADYAALIEVTSTEVITVTREENVAIWNPRTLQSEDGTRVVNESLLVAKFKPLRIYKGEKSPTVVQTQAGADSCGVDLKPGSKYLVYASGPEDDGHIFTSICSRTALVEESTQDIEVLNLTARSGSAVFQPSGSSLRFNDAIVLIQSDADDGEGLAQAMTISQRLAQSDPLSGYSQTLQAEALSTWNLGDNGEPVELQQEILTLTDEALRINPKLAQAHVVRARTYAKASKLTEAEEEIKLALNLEPQLGGAIFAQADIYRRAADHANAASWMRNFITISKQATQKAIGHEWIGNMWRDIAYHPQAINRETHLLMAWSEYKSSVDLDPKNARRLVNFAAFLNEYFAKFADAKGYAFRSLKVQESQLARYHLAAARYQELQAKADGIDAQSLRESIAKIHASTKVSLDQAVLFTGFRDVIVARLTRLQNRVRTL
jgi:tetratricopeptide (TPR) repeat protein